jgi:GTP cyclohydrolase FolE2
MEWRLARTRYFFALIVKKAAQNKTVLLPTSVPQCDGGTQPVTATASLGVDLSAQSRGIQLRVAVRPRPEAGVWLEDLIPRLEAHGSCELYPVLKRPDEKYVTERAYENPKFVEDVLRDVVLDLRADPTLAWFSAECEADESIHAHNAYASQAETLTASPAAPAAPRVAISTGVPNTPMPARASVMAMEVHA